MKTRVVVPQLVARLRQRFALRWAGIHGAPHWARVRYNGLLLYDRNGADRTVVELFATVHDVCRDNDFEDRTMEPAQPTSLRTCGARYSRSATANPAKRRQALMAL